MSATNVVVLIRAARVGARELTENEETVAVAERRAGQAVPISAGPRDEVTSRVCHRTHLKTPVPAPNQSKFYLTIAEHLQ